MASSLTYLGEKYMLYGDGVSNGGLARKAQYLKLYTSASTPNKAGTGFTEVPSVNGYGAMTVSGSFSYLSNPSRIVLPTLVWTATGVIANVAGVYLTDSSGNPLAWWERAGGPVTLAATDTFSAAGLFVDLGRL